MRILLHSGQTGVERGVQRAAAAYGLSLGGFCSSDGRDEWGALDPAIAAPLVRCDVRGPRAAVAANLETATALVMIVPDARRASAFTGIGVSLRAARARALPVLLVDPATDLSIVVDWIATHQATDWASRVYITGPRGTRWPEGEKLAWQVAARLGVGAS